MKRMVQTLAVLVVTAAWSTTGWATLIQLEALIDGAQANAGAGTGSPGTGLMTGTLDDVTNEFSWDISWSGLLGTETVAHFHGPAMPNQNAGVQVNFGAISGLTSPSVGSTTITGPQADDLVAGLWYVNIHTDEQPGGEIRGQVEVIPEPFSVALLAAGLVALTAVRRR
jgi:hypothetical protein